MNDEDDDDDDDDDDEEEWDGETWTNEGEDAEDVKDESAAYLEFLKEEVSQLVKLRSDPAESEKQSEKFGAAQDDSDDELEEESLLETPLDKVEPYGLFKGTLFSMHIFNSALFTFSLTDALASRIATGATPAL